MPSNHGAKQNNSVEDPMVYPGWDKGENYTTQTAVMDRIIPSRKNSNEKDSPATGTSQSYIFHNFCVSDGLSWKDIGQTCSEE